MPYACILPVFILMGYFTFYPIYDMIIKSFKTNAIIGEGQWCWFDNYYRLFFIELNFKPALRNTLIYTVGIVASVVFMAVVFAVWLQRSTFINGIAHRLMVLAAGRAGYVQPGAQLVQCGPAEVAERL